MKLINKEERLQELAKQKRKILNRMKKSRDLLAQDRIEKKKINEAIKSARGKNVFADLSEEEARTKMRDDIKATNIADIYPSDLEAEFDELEQGEKEVDEKQVIEYVNINSTIKNELATAEEEDDNDEVIGFDLGTGSGVMDFSNGDFDD